MLENSLPYLQKKLNGFVPDVCIVLGSGLADIVKAMNINMEIDYSDIPDFPRPSVLGHNGRIYIGTIGKHKIICMQGRIHLYEGYPPQIIAKLIGIIADLGVKTIIFTNAAGSLRTSIPAGSLLMISDHINFSGRNPLVGMKEAPFFPDTSNAYDADLRNKLRKLAEELNIELYEGVYGMTLGPNYETPAEVKYFGLCGADVIGMSTVPEVIAAVHKGMKVIGFSVVSNMGCGLTDEVINHNELLKTVYISCADLTILLKEFLQKY